MICKILCFVGTPQGILRKESNRRKIFVNDAICYFSNKSPQRLESAQFLVFQLILHMIMFEYIDLFLLLCYLYHVSWMLV